MIEVWKADAVGMQEKQLRQFAARRAIELGYGGITFVSEAHGINRKTIKVGIEEIQDEDLHIKSLLHHGWVTFSFPRIVRVYMEKSVW